MGTEILYTPSRRFAGLVLEPKATVPLSDVIAVWHRADTALDFLRLASHWFGARPLN